MVLSIAGTTDKITIGSFFFGDDPAGSYNPIQQVKFDDGTTWDINALKAQLFAGTAGVDNIAGTTIADIINGQAGADSLYGRGGDDTLNGGADNDSLYGEGGNDTLDGGTGNDSLSGGLGNDTYLFGKGDGQDSIGSDFDSTAGKLNTLQFKAGVAANEIVATRSGNDLILSIAGTTDKVTVGAFFYNNDPAGSYNPIQQVKFDDGTTWDLNTIKTKVTPASGFSAPPVLWAGLSAPADKMNSDTAVTGVVGMNLPMQLDQQVDSLVAAMAAFAPPSSGETILAVYDQPMLHGPIAANWK